MRFAIEICPQKRFLKKVKILSFLKKGAYLGPKNSFKSISNGISEASSIGKWSGGSGKLIEPKKNFSKKNLK